MSLSKINSRINLDYLTKEKENLYFDRKRAKISLQDLANEIASFANSNGGLIAVGITDKGEIEGFNVYGKEKLNECQKVVTSYLKNTPTYRMELINIKNEKKEDYENVSSDMLIEKIDNAEKLSIDTVDKLLEYDNAVICFMSCANISPVIDKYHKLLKEVK